MTDVASIPACFICVNAFYPSTFPVITIKSYVRGYRNEFDIRIEIPRPPRIHLPIEDEKTVQSQSPGENTDSGRRQMTRLRADDFPMYSRKVFIGGLPHEINPRLITKFFERFGKNVVDWPHRECCDVKAPPNGYAFVIFNNEHAVRRLIYASDMKRGRLLVDLKLADNTTKTIQVRPWNLSFLRCSLVTLTPFLDRYSVFVGGVPRTTTAMELAHLFQQVINNVVEVSLEVEPGTNYPRGSARVVFGTREAYLVALAMRRFTLFTLKERRMANMPRISWNLSVSGAPVFALLLRSMLVLDTSSSTWKLSQTGIPKNHWTFEELGTESKRPKQWIFCGTAGTLPLDENGSHILPITDVFKCSQ
uniref:RRM domain-containing protein n=1 Tax=Setaria digitata TaxID=48799 RepID=A0A915PMU2_9BILA